MFEARGPEGQVRLGYRTVATFGVWSLSTAGRLTADAVDADAFWSLQAGPQTVRVRMGSGWWTWTECAVHRVAPLVAHVGGSMVKG